MSARLFDRGRRTGIDGVPIAAAMQWLARARGESSFELEVSERTADARARWLAGMMAGVVVGTLPSSDALVSAVAGTATLALGVGLIVYAVFGLSGTSAGFAATTRSGCRRRQPCGLFAFTL